MKITDTAQYISLVLHSLEHVLLPEITSPGAKATAEIMKQVMGELLKRERYTPRLLDEHIAEGNVLLESMTALRAELSGNAEENRSDKVLGEKADQASGFPSLADKHSRLTDSIARVAAALVVQRSRTGEPAQQEYLSALLHKAAAWECAYYSAQREAVVTVEPVPVNTTGSPLTQESLQSFLRTRHPDGEQCAVTAFEPIPGGFGKQTYRATLRDSKGALQNLIVRKSDPTPMVLHGGFFIDQEFYLLKDIFAGGVPVAEPIFLGAGVPGVDADFYVMAALLGKVPSSFLGAASANIPEPVLLHMAELLAQIHKLKIDDFSNYLPRYGHEDMRSDTVESCYRRCIAEWKAYSTRVEHLSSPYLIYLLDWLDLHIPHNTNRPVLVHGDFNIHNVLAENERVTGVLDWECAMFGAPEQDLAYIKPIISKHIGWDRFVNHYQASGGQMIDEASMNFYMAFSAMRLSVIFNRGIRNLQHGVTRDIRYAVVELGLTPEFMNQALSCVAAADRPPAL